MSSIHVAGLDHVHVEVTDRQAAADWFDRIFGLVPADGMAVWAKDPKGPLFLQSRSGASCLALFERQPPKTRAGDHTIAFNIDGNGFLAFIDRLQDGEIKNTSGKPLTAADVVDHQLSWSLYFSDPDGNRFELTTYDHGLVGERLREDSMPRSGHP